MIAVALAAGFITWLAVRDNGHSPATTTTASVPAAFAITPVNLKRLAISIHQPIFWLGQKARNTYELTKGQEGKIYVRYLPAGVRVGSAKPYLTVATYPFPGAYAALEKQAAARGAVTAKLAGGGYRRPRRQLSRERPRRLPERQLPGRGLRPEGGAGDGARLGRRTGRPRGPPSLHRHRTPERHGAGRGLPRRAEGPCRPDWSPVLLGRAESGIHLRVDAGPLGNGVHPLSALRNARRRPEGPLPHGGHVSVSRAPTPPSPRRRRARPGSAWHTAASRASTMPTRRASISPSRE